VKELELPAVDEEFVKKVSGAEDVDAFKKSVREHLEHEALHTYEDGYYLELVDSLREKSNIKYPPQMLSDEEEQVLHRIEHDLSHRKLDLDLYLKLRNTDRETFIQEEVKPTALDRLERSLVMDALTKQFDIEVNEKQLQDEITQVVNNLIYSGEFEAMQKEMGKKRFAESVSMEAANRALEKTIRAKLKELADPSAAEAKEADTPVENETKDETKSAEDKPKKRTASKPKEAQEAKAETVKKPASKAKAAKAKEAKVEDGD
jgi:trigger factor